MEKFPFGNNVDWHLFSIDISINRERQNDRFFSFLTKKRTERSLRCSFLPNTDRSSWRNFSFVSYLSFDRSTLKRENILRADEEDKHHQMLLVLVIVSSLIGEVPSQSNLFDQLEKHLVEFHQAEQRVGEDSRVQKETNPMT